MPRCTRWLLKHDRRLVWSGIILFVLAISAACFWKYASYLYNALDLAIINQAFWNTLHGHPYQISIHPHSYLGDHAELAIVLLLPIYSLLPDPRTLLVLQAVALALPAWPIFLIAKRRLAGLKDSVGPLLPLLMATLWLLNLSVHSIGLFEFHILPFAIFPIFMAALAYERGGFRAFLFWCGLALLVREDVALVVAAFGLLAWMEKRDWRWRLAPIIGGAVWFFAMMRLVAHFAPAGNYKFLIYYAWLGDSLPMMLWGALTHPLQVARHLLSISNLEMLLGLLMPLAFLPIIRPARLILLIGPLAQILLGAPGGGMIAVQTHYATLILPAVFLAAIDAWPALWSRKKIWLFNQEEIKPGIAFLAKICTVYALFALSPLPHAAVRAWSGKDAAVAKAADEIIARIPPDASVAASYRLLPRLSSRASVYSVQYIFVGKTQFGELPYPAPAGITHVAIEENDINAFRDQAFVNPSLARQYGTGRARLSGLTGATAYADGGFELFIKNSPEDPGLGPDALRPVSTPAFKGVKPVAAAARPDSIEKNLIIETGWLASDLDWRLVGQQYPLVIRLRDSAGRTVSESLHVLDVGAPSVAPAGEPRRRIWRLSLDGLRPGKYDAVVSLERQESVLTLDSVLTSIRKIKKSEPVLTLEPLTFQVE